MAHEDSGSTTARSKNVGYCRPPVEHQFKPGQKPPPRKAKPKKEQFKSSLEALWKVLHEQRRLMVNGKVVWMSNAELIVRKAFKCAEKDDSPTISSLVGELMLVGDNQTLETPDQTLMDPDATPGSNTYLVETRPGDEPIIYDNEANFLRKLIQRRRLLP